MLYYRDKTATVYMQHLYMPLSTVVYSLLLLAPAAFANGVTSACNSHYCLLLLVLTAVVNSRYCTCSLLLMVAAVANLVNVIP